MLTFFKTNEVVGLLYHDIFHDEILLDRRCCINETEKLSLYRQVATIDPEFTILKYRNNFVYLMTNKNKIDWKIRITPFSRKKWKKKTHTFYERQPGGCVIIIVVVEFCL